MLLQNSLFCLMETVSIEHLSLLKKREGVQEMGTKPLKALSLRGYQASNRGSKGSRTTRKPLGPLISYSFPFLELYHRKRIFWKTFLVYKKHVQAGGRYKNPIQETRKQYLPPKSFHCGPHFFKESSSLEQGSVWFPFPNLTSQLNSKGFSRGETKG